MRIGELARATGTKAETIRYYERERILPAADRTDSNYRDYSDEHLATLKHTDRIAVLRHHIDALAKVTDMVAGDISLASALVTSSLVPMQFNAPWSGPSMS